MAVRKLLQRGDPKLKAENQLVADITSPYILQVITDLIDTMHETGLIGIAAPQIGENVQIFVTEPRETEARPKDQADVLRVYINPQITDQSNEKVVIWEGCGCVDNAESFGPVSRPKVITISATNKDGVRFSLTADGILGRVMLHEHDHLHGLEFVDHIDESLLLPLSRYIEEVKPLSETHANSQITIKKYEELQ